MTHATEPAVIGDGVLTFPGTSPDAGHEQMPSIIDDTIAGLILTESAGNLQANNRDGRNIGTVAMGTLQGGMSKTFNELGPVESRAVSGVMATPVAAPTV